eukprot:scaffold4935_cov67-Phaeocystis_antarctica.AAC.1
METKKSTSRGRLYLGRTKQFMICIYSSRPPISLSFLGGPLDTCHKLFSMTEIRSPERGRLFFIRLIRHIRQKYVISPDKGLITRYQSVADISLIYQADTVVVCNPKQAALEAQEPACATRADDRPGGGNDQLTVNVLGARISRASSASSFPPPLRVTLGACQRR